MKKIIYTFLAVLAIAGTGCKKFVDGYDVSPNSPVAVTNPLLLSNAEVAYFATANGQLSRQTSMLVQQNTGIDFQSKDINDYLIREGTNSNEWQVIYASGIVNLNKLYTQAGSSNPYYQGMSRIISAMFLGVATDLWGDVPSKEAGMGINGPASFNPAFDAQKTVIEDIQKYLDEAILLLANAETKNIMLPGSDDIIFGGDPKKWIATAHVLKARYYNRLSKKDPAGSATSAIASLAAAKAAGFTGNASDCMAKFGTKSNEYNQWYAFTVVARAGYIKAGKTLTDTMNAWGDPRREFYFLPDSGNAFNGSAPDVPSTYSSEVGPYLATADAPFPLVTYYEAKFIEAEAQLRAGDNAKAATALNEAVIASVTKVTSKVPDIVFSTAHANENAGTITIAKIMLQKYVAMYSQIEAYSDWRRTDYPKLTPNAASILGAIPRRFPTVLEERLYNKNAPAISDIKLPVWWDQ
ncbi:MAG: SusD/RagB family nutrient-binding outer membrane lipoprotein [Bacteroidia bacterium]|nr:SusD/RagB family nutrient-binding outer membrane lipoprotein [Bacteroidia bacterium]